MKEYNSILKREIDYIIYHFNITDKMEKLMLKFYYNILINIYNEDVLDFNNFCICLIYVMKNYNSLIYCKEKTLITNIENLNKIHFKVCNYSTEKKLNKLLFKTKDQFTSKQELIKTTNNLILRLNEIKLEEDDYSKRYYNILDGLYNNLGKDIECKIKEFISLSELIENNIQRKEEIEEKINKIIIYNSTKKVDSNYEIIKTKYIKKILENEKIINKHYYITYLLKLEYNKYDFIRDKYLIMENVLPKYKESKDILLDMLYNLCFKIKYINETNNETIIRILNQLIEYKNKDTYIGNLEYILKISGINSKLIKDYKLMVNDNPEIAFNDVKELLEQINNKEIDIDNDDKIFREEILNMKEELDKELYNYVKQLKKNYNKIWN